MRVPGNKAVVSVCAFAVGRKFLVETGRQSDPNSIRRTAAMIWRGAHIPSVCACALEMPIA